MERWIELRSAYHVAKLGTVSAAAEALGVHRATVNRHIDALETDLGAKLFLRHGRGYVLTETGQEFLKVAQRADDMITDFAARTRAGTPEVSGEIVLSVHSGLASVLMQPIVAFRTEHPNTRVTLLANDDLVRLEYGEAHVALYGGPRPEQDNYVVQQFGGLRFGLYAHSSYVARNGIPSAPADFANHDFAVNPALASRVPFEAWLMRRVPEERMTIKASHPRVAQEATVAGVAIGFLPEPYARGRAELHEVIAPRSNWTPRVWLVTHVDLHRTEKVQAMLRCIKDAHAE